MYSLKFSNLSLVCSMMSPALSLSWSLFETYLENELSLDNEKKMGSSEFIFNKFKFTVEINRYFVFRSDL